MSPTTSPPTSTSTLRLPTVLLLIVLTLSACSGLAQAPSPEAQASLPEAAQEALPTPTGAHSHPGTNHRRHTDRHDPTHRHADRHSHRHANADPAPDADCGNAGDGVPWQRPGG